MSEDGAGRRAEAGAAGTGTGGIPAHGGGGSWVLPWALFLVLQVCFFPAVGLRGLWEKDEGRYTAVALEMLAEGDFVSPALHHERHHFTKPPLTYWALAGSMALFGKNEWAVRLPNTLAYWGTCLLLLSLGAFFSSEPRWLPALLYGTSLLPWTAASIVTTDTMLTFFETLAVVAYVNMVGTGTGRRASAWRAVMWGSLGLAFLTKGPPGLLPLIPILVHSRMGPYRNRLLDVRSVALFTFLAVPWFVAVASKYPGLLRHLIVHETVERVATGVHQRHPQWYGGFVVYVPTLLLGCFPWWGPAWRALRRLVSGVWSEAGRSEGRFDRRHMFLLCWFGVPLVLFLLARSRLPLYVLPLYVPLSLLMSMGVTKAADGHARIPMRTLSLGCACLVALQLLSSHLSLERDSRSLSRAIKRQVQAPFNEVVFVDMAPRYGVSMYLDLEVEGVSLVRPARKTPYWSEQTLREELEEVNHQERWLFVVLPGQREVFEQELRTQALSPQYEGSWRQCLFVTVRERSGPPGAGQSAKRSRAAATMATAMAQQTQDV